MLICSRISERSHISFPLQPFYLHHFSLIFLRQLLILPWLTTAWISIGANLARAGSAWPFQPSSSIPSATHSMPCTKIPYSFLQPAAPALCICQEHSLGLLCLALPLLFALSLKAHLKQHFFLEAFPKPSVRINLSLSAAIRITL